MNQRLKSHAIMMKHENVTFFGERVLVSTLVLPPLRKRRKDAKPSLEPNEVKVRTSPIKLGESWHRSAFTIRHREYRQVEVKLNIARLQPRARLMRHWPLPLNDLAVKTALDGLMLPRLLPSRGSWSVASAAMVTTSFEKPRPSTRKRS